MRHDSGTMTPKTSEGFAAVGIFLTVIWPMINRQIFDGKLNADDYRAFRILLLVFNVAMIGFALHAISGADEVRTINPGLMKFGIALFAIFLLRHTVELFRSRGNWVRVPEHATISQVGGMTWIAIPDEPSEPSVLDEHLTEFDPKALSILVDSLSHGISPFDPLFQEWMAGADLEDPRRLSDYIPGNWSELFWQGAANYLISYGGEIRRADRKNDDPDAVHFENATAGAILVAISVAYPDVVDRIVAEAADRPGFIDFLDSGYFDYQLHKGSKPVPAIEALLPDRREG